MNVVVTGGSSGLGRAILDELSNDEDIMWWNISADNGDFGAVDVRDRDALRRVSRGMPTVDVLINNAGINHLSWLQDLRAEDWHRVMDTNAMGIFNTVQAFLPHLIRSEGAVINVVSNASHLPMTASLAYNASKGAAHIMTLQLARELTRKYGITVLGISPAKLAGTRMSEYIDREVQEIRGWSEEEARTYQLAGLLRQEEVDPAALARFVRFLISDREVLRSLSGCILPFGA